jgi:DNA-binding SARP family transcriptional activator
VLSPPFSLVVSGRGQWYVAPEMEFRILGSFEVWDGARQIDVRGAKRRALLALLVLHANEVVGKDRLIDELWGENAPPTAGAALHNHISRLRKVLGPDSLVTRAWGYVLRVDPESIDLQKFERLVEEAEALPAQERSAKFGEALALWRGSALADLTFEPALRLEIARLEELRLATHEARIDADLEVGRHAQVIPELETLIAQHPLRERLRGQLILALYRDGRQAEALEVYRETRRLLADQLGLEPSPALRELERAILRQDPALATASQTQEPVPAEESQSRWRWPRSALIAIAVLLALAAGGVAAAIAMTRGTPHSTTVTEAGRTTVISAVESPLTTLAHARTKSTTRRHPRRHAPVVRKTKPKRVPLPVVHRKPATLVTSRPASRPATKRKAVPTHVGAQRVYWLEDNFANSAMNTDLWGARQTTGSGVQAVQQNGRLEFSIAPDVEYHTDPSWAGGGGVGANYGTNCLLTGDFDARIDFKLLKWPKGDGVAITLGVYFPPPHEAQWGINRSGGAPSGEVYSSWLDNTVGEVPTSDAHGTLRLVRKNGVLTAYYRHDRQWASLGSGPAAGPASLIVMLSTHPGWYANIAASAAFDNFGATASSVQCPAGIPLPPRRPA